LSASTEKKNDCSNTNTAKGQHAHDGPPILQTETRLTHSYKVFYWAQSKNGKRSVRDGENYIRTRTSGHADITRVHSVTDFEGKQLVCYDVESPLRPDELTRLLKLRVEPQERVSALLGSGS
jgi:hypothetical protein